MKFTLSRDQKTRFLNHQDLNSQRRLSEVEIGNLNMVWAGGGNPFSQWREKRPRESGWNLPLLFSWLRQFSRDCNCCNYTAPEARPVSQAYISNCCLRSLSSDVGIMASYDLQFEMMYLRIQIKISVLILNTGKEQHFCIMSKRKPCIGQHSKTKDF